MWFFKSKTKLVIVDSVRINIVDVVISKSSMGWVSLTTLKFLWMHIQTGCICRIDAKILTAILLLPIVPFQAVYRFPEPFALDNRTLVRMHHSAWWWVTLATCPRHLIYQFQQTHGLLRSPGVTWETALV
jgi:hypothetical protein